MAVKGLLAIIITWKRFLQISKVDRQNDATKSSRV